MIDSPAPTIIYTVIYFIIVGLGPRYMKNRKPFELTFILIQYNVFMTLLNLYIAIEVCRIILSFEITIPN
jgi:elongation of very long chain fatty acids protein 4